MTLRIRSFPLAAALLLTLGGSSSLLAQQTAFTYQGVLKSGATPVSGSVDITLRLFDVESGGTALASIAFPGETIVDGLVSLDVDFGPGQFTGSARWVEVEVDGQTLSPRQPLRPTPYAMRALSAESSAQWASSGSAIMNQNTGFVGINRDYTVGLEWFGVHAPVNSGYGGMYVTTEGANAWPFYGYKAGTQAAWTYLDGSNGDFHINVDGNKVTITDEGMVGIRTTSPLYPLHVVSTNTDRTMFASNSTSTGAAIRGHATHATGLNYGLYGETDSSSGTAIYGHALATSGSTVAARLRNESSSGIGVSSLAVSNTGTTWGGFFQNAAPGGGGVWGNAISGSGNTSGVLGQASSATSSGVRGLNSGNGLGAYGVSGELTHSSSQGAGVFGKAPFFGVVGHSVSGGNGVTGVALAFGNGVVGEANSSNSAGVRGLNGAVSGTTYGVQGVVNSPAGYAGHFTGRGYFSGNLGLGTTTPANPLSVAGDADLTGRVSIGITGADARLLVRGVTGEDAFRVRVEGGTKLLVKDNGGVGIGSNFGTVPSDGLRVLGNVGIGVDPTDKLHVSGNIRATGSVFASCGTLSCSDERFKANVQPLAGALEMVEKLQPVWYDWKRDEFPDRQFTSQRQTGLIAQQVRDVMPEVVQYDGEGYLSVDYGRLTPLLVEALRELREEKDAQIAELQAQKDREIADLNQRLAALERLVAGSIDR